MKVLYTFFAIIALQATISAAEITIGTTKLTIPTPAGFGQVVNGMQTQAQTPSSTRPVRTVQRPVYRQQVKQKRRLGYMEVGLIGALVGCLIGGVYALIQKKRKEKSEGSKSTESGSKE